LEWKILQPDTLSVTVPLANTDPGALTLEVKQYGRQAPDAVALRAFAQAGRLESFTLRAGDVSGLLKGSRLDEVAGLSVGGVAFKPGELTSVGGGDELTLDPVDAGGVERIISERNATAKVTLKDGRVVKLKVAIGAPRPKILLIGKSILASTTEEPIAIQLTGADEAPQGAQLTFSIRAEAPTHFSARDVIEVATLDGAASTKLTAANGLTVADAQVAVASLDPAKVFGDSAFGPLRFRIVQDGAAGEWQPLVTLVRLPQLRGLKCEDGPKHPCELSGSNLFLIDAISNDPAFDQPVEVPAGFPGAMIHVPRPRDGRLYLKLHDAPRVVNQAVISAERHVARPVTAGATKPAA
jgi:hypothetical protein